MTTTRVKICGITRREDAVAAAECGAWAVGFVFDSGSPRFVTASRAAAIAKELPRDVLRVGVFLDASLDFVRAIEAEVALDLVQLHGTGASGTGRAIGVERVVLAAPLARDEDLDRALDLWSAFLLVDHDRSGPSQGDGTVSWRLASRLALHRAATLLAGGLNAGNVAAGIRSVRPWGVDVSRGVEVAPGVKDRARIRQFIESVRRADAS